MMSERAREIHAFVARVAAWMLAALSAACATAPAPAPKSAPPAVAAPVTEPPAKPAPSARAVFRPAAWTDLPGWREDNVADAWSAFTASCAALGAREYWRDPCAAASSARIAGADAARRFFEQHFTAYQVGSTESGDEGLITGYYEPLLRGSRKPAGRY